MKNCDWAWKQQLTQVDIDNNNNKYAKLQIILNTAFVLYGAFFLKFYFYYCCTGSTLW
jgi:hypothetical protein